MNSFTPYDPATKPEITIIYQSPLRQSRIATSQVNMPARLEHQSVYPQTMRQTIRIDKPAELNPLKESIEMTAHLQRRPVELNIINNGRANNQQVNRLHPIYQSHNINGHHESTTTQGIDANAIKQLLSLQAQLQQNPNLIAQTQNLIDNLGNSPRGTVSVKTQNTNLVQAMTDLEKEVSLLRVENSQQKQAIRDMQFELENTKQQLTQERNKTSNLNNDLEHHQDLRDKLDEYVLELQKLEGERDFHHKNHVELRKELYNKTSAEFQINKLKRELHYKTGELGFTKDRCGELEAQINELLIFAEKPRNERQHNAETFYAKRIVELEAALKKVKDEKFELENFTVSSIDHKKSVGHGFGPKVEKLSDDTRMAQLEFDTLKRRVETLKAENEHLKRQLESSKEAKSANFASNNAENDKYQKLLKDYLRQIDGLKAELNTLKKGPMQADNSNRDDLYVRTIEEQKQKINTLQQEKTALQIKIDTLNKELMDKNREIADLKQNNVYGVDEETVNHLREANKRLTVEIGRLQDQFRKMESINRSSMVSSMNRDKI